MAKEVREREELQKRKQDAEELLNHYLIKEFFEYQEFKCYNNMINISEIGGDEGKLKYFALLGKCTADLHVHLKKCATLPPVPKDTDKHILLPMD